MTAHIRADHQPGEWGRWRVREQTQSARAHIVESERQRRGQMLGEGWQQGHGAGDTWTVSCITCWNILPLPPPALPTHDVWMSREGNSHHVESDRALCHGNFRKTLRAGDIQGTTVGSGHRNGQIVPRRWQRSIYSEFSCCQQGPQKQWGPSGGHLRDPALGLHGGV